MTSAHWQTTRYRIDLAQVRIMGIVNVTPDSFSDGGRHDDPARAVAHCETLLREGADILDIGGESTRPGSDPVSAETEWARVAPVLRAALTFGCPISVDTVKVEVMRNALDLGVDIVNDVNALRAPGAEPVIAAHSNSGICLMHMQGEPRSMQSAPRYDDVVAEVGAFLAERARVMRGHGVAADRIVLDPGFGFGKTVAQNFELLDRQAELLAIGYPLLAGWSRKSSLGTVTGRSPDDRVSASIAAALAAVLHGARIVRVHDVAPTLDALKVWRAAGLVAVTGQSSTIPAS